MHQECVPFRSDMVGFIRASLALLLTFAALASPQAYSYEIENEIGYFDPNTEPKGPPHPHSPST